MESGVISMELKAMKSPSLFKGGQDRFVLVDTETGEIVNNAQGYGYKTAAGAHRAWAYMHRDKSKDKEKKVKYKRIRDWLKQHSEFTNLMEAELFDMAKGAIPDQEFNAELFRSILDQCGLEIDFSVRDLMTVWKQGY